MINLIGQPDTALQLFTLCVTKQSDELNKLESELFYRDGFSVINYDPRVYRNSYILGMVDSQDYFSEVFYSNLSAEFSPSQIVEWIEDTYQYLVSTNSMPESLTQTVGVLRAFSDYSPRGFAEAQEYQSERLSIIFERYALAKAELDKLPSIG